VPNDLAADSMLKTARKDLAADKRDSARAALSKIVQQYPRTDAAAAATVALVTLGEQERKDLEAEIARMREDNKKTTAALAELQSSVEGIKNEPPKVIVQQVTASKPKAPAKKSKTTRRRSR
jgi:hypothetical protein